MKRDDSLYVYDKEHKRYRRKYAEGKHAAAVSDADEEAGGSSIYARSIDKEPETYAQFHQGHGPPKHKRVMNFILTILGLGVVSILLYLFLNNFLDDIQVQLNGPRNAAENVVK